MTPRARFRHSVFGFPSSLARHLIAVWAVVRKKAPSGLLRGAGKRTILDFAMLTLSGISKSFAGRTLFDDVGLQVNRGDRIGLVGPNGAGKSTLFSLILGDATPDGGSIAFQRGFTTGHLPQESAPVGEQTVLELAISVSAEVVELQKKIHAWENEHPDASDEIDHNIHARFDELGGYQLEP